MAIKSNSGVLISAAVSLAALIVSLGQVWVTKISNERALGVAVIQKQSELEQQRIQNEKETTLLEIQKKREWDLSAARFITDNRKAIFSGNPNERWLFAQIIGTVYPPEISTVFLKKIEAASWVEICPGTARWSNARRGRPVVRR